MSKVYFDKFWAQVIIFTKVHIEKNPVILVALKEMGRYKKVL